MILGLIIALAAFLADFLSKYYIAELFAKDAAIKSFGSYFNLVEAWNTGVSFSMFNDGGILGTVLLSAFALGVVAFLFSWLRHENKKNYSGCLRAHYRRRIGQCGGSYSLWCSV